MEFMDTHAGDGGSGKGRLKVAVSNG